MEGQVNRAPKSFTLVPGAAARSDRWECRSRKSNLIKASQAGCAASISSGCVSRSKSKVADTTALTAANSNAGQLSLCFAGPHTWMVRGVFLLARNLPRWVDDRVTGTRRRERPVHIHMLLADTFKTLEGKGKKWRRKCRATTDPEASRHFLLHSRASHWHQTVVVHPSRWTRPGQRHIHARAHRHTPVVYSQDTSSAAHLARQHETYLTGRGAGI